MKATHLTLLIFAFLLPLATPFVVRHRHKRKTSKPMFKKMKKAELLRMRQRQLYNLEVHLLEKRDKASRKKQMFSRKLYHGVHLSQKQKKGRELYLAKTKKVIPKLRVKNTFVLRENDQMNIHKNISKMKKSHKYSKKHKFGFNNKVIQRYLLSKKKVNLDNANLQRYEQKSNTFAKGKVARDLLEAKAKKDVKPVEDKYLKFSKTSGIGMKGLVGGITYVEREKMTKPMYLNMSPVYDYRGY